MKLLLLCLCISVASAGLAPLITSKQRSLPDRWIVKIKDADQLDKVAEAIEDKFSRMRLPIPRVTKIRRVMSALTLQIPPQLMNGIRSLDNIEYIEQDSIETLAGSQNNPSWGLDRIDSRTGKDGVFNYNDNAQGQGVNVYILDTGVQTTHADFGGRAHMLFGDGNAASHGTHCAGTVVGSTYGIARQANIYSVQVCKGGGCALSLSLQGLDAVLVHAAGKGGVISRSLSGLKGNAPSLRNAMQKMWDNGFVIAHAAGNSGIDACDYTPQKMDQVTAAGASNGVDKMTYYSNHGPCVDIFAPGQNIISAKYSTESDSGSSTASGTSMACPHVAGGLAVIFGSMQNPTPQSVKDALLNNATKDVVTNAKASHNRLLYVSPI